MKRFFLISCIVSGLLICVIDCHAGKSKRDILPVEFEMKMSSFWFNDAQKNLKEKLKNTLNQKKAKNVIYFLGDGMSIETITAGRILKGQQEGQLGERSKLSFEEFPAVGLSKTYCVDKQVSDSASTATAYLGGIKANFYTVGVNAKVKLNDCKSARDPINQVESIIGWAQRANKSTGFVTTASVTDASPAGVYSHVSNREFQSDALVKQLGGDTANCKDIAQQLIDNDVGKKLNVIMGGGTKYLLPNGTLDFYGNSGERLDGRNLIREWRHSKKEVAKTVFNRKQLLQIDPQNVDYLMGIFAHSDMAYKSDADPIKEPDLETMTEKAIEIVQKNENGFFLFIEAAHIDKAHHDNLAQKALVETVELSKAVQKAIDMTDSEETLIVITSDHGHTMSISGHPDIGNNILGLSTERDGTNLPYTTLNYANGPSYYMHFNSTATTGHRLNLTDVDVLDKDFAYPGIFPVYIETHGGGDVAVFAKGPWSHLFTGVVEQNMLPHIIGFAACIGDGMTMCQEGKSKKTKNSGPVIQSSMIMLIGLYLISTFLIKFK